MDTIFSSLGKKKKFKRRKRYAARRNYLIWIAIFGVFCLFVMFSPLWTGVKYSKPVNQSSPGVTQNARMYKVDSKYNPKLGLLISEFYIGNEQKMSDVSSEKQLDNLTYKTKYKIRKGDDSQYRTKLVRVNDHFIVLETTGVQPGFVTLRYDITPKKINKNLSTEYQRNNVINFYVEESNVKKQSSLFKTGKQMYQIDYTNFVVGKYQDAIKHKHKQISHYRSIKQADKSLVQKLNVQLDNAVKSDKGDIQNQIDDAESDISDQNKNIKSAKKSIKNYQDRIENVKLRQANAE